MQWQISIISEQNHIGRADKIQCGPILWWAPSTNSLIEGLYVSRF